MIGKCGRQTRKSAGERARSWEVLARVPVFSADKYEPSPYVCLACKHHILCLSFRSLARCGRMTVTQASQKNAVSQAGLPSRSSSHISERSWPAKPKLAAHQRAKAGGRPRCGLPDAQADVRRGYVSSRRMLEERSCHSREQVRCHAAIVGFFARKTRTSCASPLRLKQSASAWVMCCPIWARAERRSPRPYPQRSWRRRDSSRGWRPRPAG